MVATIMMQQALAVRVQCTQECTQCPRQPWPSQWQTHCCTAGALPALYLDTHPHATKLAHTRTELHVVHVSGCEQGDAENSMRIRVGMPLSEGINRCMPVALLALLSLHTGGALKHTCPANAPIWRQCNHCSSDSTNL